VIPHIVILAGPNGAGKSTAAPALLKGALRVSLFVNADTIARGLAGFEPDDAALLAGRVMVERIRELTARRVRFAIETTLAGRSLASWLRNDAVAAGFRSHLVFLWLPSPETAIARVQARVRLGGHDIPTETIRRRYRLGIRNFFSLYQPLVTTWRVYDSWAASSPRLLAVGGIGQPTRVVRKTAWRQFEEQARDE
jgi:predicted ABC-type ATPase